VKKIVLPIDTKSLFYNIKNDNLSGHTATVSTCIKQGNSINGDLMQVYKIPKQIDYIKKIELIENIEKNSKSRTKINNIFAFEKIKVNGKIINIDKQFSFYIKEEVDPTKYQYGRIKLHYPISFSYTDEEIDINNRYVINKISEHVKEYAFIVNSFEYDFDDEFLNFNITIVGESQVPYSKVFINNKGVGNKFSNIFNEYSDSYDIEIISLRKHFMENIQAESYKEIYLKNQKLAYDICRGYLLKCGYKNVRCINEEFSYSLYDFECEKNNEIEYIQLYYTTTNIKYFNISSKRIRFLNDFERDTKVILISEILDNYKINEYTFDDIMKFSKTINSMMLREENI